MKAIKPGQFYWHNGNLFRAAKRYNGCQGCDLDGFFTCPNLKVKNCNRERPNCEENMIIFKKV